LSSRRQRPLEAPRRRGRAPEGKVEVVAPRAESQRGPGGDGAPLNLGPRPHGAQVFGFGGVGRALDLDRGATGAEVGVEGEAG
jgi:hypothetical protein